MFNDGRFLMTSFVLLHVDRPEASARFYTGLLDCAPVEMSPTFALFALESGLMLGLWPQTTVEPAAVAGGGGAELAFTVPDVDSAYAGWSRRGLTFLRAPTGMDFGRRFVPCDPDGHRLRVFAPT